MLAGRVGLRRQCPRQRDVEHAAVAVPDRAYLAQILERRRERPAVEVVEGRDRARKRISLADRVTVRLVGGAPGASGLSRLLTPAVAGGGRAHGEGARPRIALTTVVSPGTRIVV